MSSFLWDIVAVSAQTLTMEDFFSTFLKKKMKRWTYIILWCSFFVFHLSAMRMFNGYLGNIAGNIIILNIVCLFSYQASLAVKEMMIFFAISLSGISEGIVAAVLLCIKGNIQGNQMLYSIMAKIVFWCIIRGLAILYKGKIEGIRQKSYGAFVVTAVVLNIGLMVGILKITEETPNDMLKTWFVFIMLILLVFDIVIFKLYVMFQEQNEIKQITQEYAKQLQIYDMQLNQKQASMEESRRQKHDIKNNMIYLQELLRSNPQEAERYLNEFIGDTIENKEEISKSGNFPVDALLNYKNTIAKSKNIKIKLEQNIPTTLPYKSSDLCVVLGNLLDNAMEAVENSENKEIEVRMAYVRNRLKITVKNHYAGELTKDRNGNFISQKKDQKNHGIGLKSVTKIVNSYNGIIEISTGDSVFQVDILM